MSDFEKFKQKMGKTKVSEQENRPIIKKPKKVITTSLIIDEIIKALNPLELLNPDEVELLRILTTPKGNPNRNQTFQRNNIIKPLIDFLIKIGLIK